MLKKIEINNLFPLAAYFLIFILMINTPPVFSQDGTLLQVGRQWSIVWDNGNIGGAGLSGCYFPADFDIRFWNMVGGNQSYVLFTDYDGDAVEEGKEVAPYCIFAPMSVPWNPSGTIIEPARNFTRYMYPSNYVNDEQVVSIPFAPVAPDQLIGTSDQTVTHTFQYGCGVNGQRTVLGWSQTNHNEYLIGEVIYTNVTDTDPNFSKPVTFKNFTIYFPMWSFTFRSSHSYGHNPSGEGTGMHSDEMMWYHYYGAQPEDSLRIVYGYDADDPMSPGDQMGMPDIPHGGRLMATNIKFISILHASEKPYVNTVNDIDDPLQPKITEYIDYDENGVFSSNGEVTQAFYEKFTNGSAFVNPMPNTPEGTHHAMNSDEMGSPDYRVIGAEYWTESDGGRHMLFPYDSLAPGESIRIVGVWGVTGLDARKAYDIGLQWQNQTLEKPENLPNDQTGFFPENFVFPTSDQYDINKDLWLSTGIDSVHKTVSKAKWNFEHNYQVPASPPPPEQWVQGTGEGVEIKWSNPEVEALSNFDGYRVMRKVGTLDTNWVEQIYRTDASEKAEEHQFTDTSVKFGADYFYYVQAGVKIPEDDINAYPTSRGKTIWSSRLLLPNKIPVSPLRKYGQKLSEIRIVPNPYNINDSKIYEPKGGYGWRDGRGLLFFNMPKEVTIKIFTEDGDLVKTIEPNPAITEGGLLKWDLLTDNEQVVSSGLYIAVFEKSDGSVSFQKFLIVR